MKYIKKGFSGDCVLESVLNGLTLLVGIAVLAVGLTWWLLFLKTRDKTGEANQKAKPGERKLLRWFWLLFAAWTGCMILVNCFF